MSLLNQLAAQLKVEGPVTSRLFVASIDFRVDELKLQEVFGMAGHITQLSLFRDRDGKSRGMAVVEYETPYEALNAVSMFNRQQLMDRQMTVRFDAKPPDSLDLLLLQQQQQESKPTPKLPSGLKSIGTGLSIANMPPPSSSSSSMYGSDYPSLNGPYGGSSGGGSGYTSSYHSNKNTNSSSNNGGGGSSNSSSYTNGSSSSRANSNQLHVGSNGSGDIRIVSSGSNGSLSISNRIGNYSNASHGSGASSSSASISSYSSQRGGSSYSSSSSSSKSSHSSKVFVKNVSALGLALYFDDINMWGKKVVCLMQIF